MAEPAEEVVQANNESKMTLRVNVGTQGSPVYKNRTFNYVNPEATDLVLYNVFQGLGELQEHTVTRIIRTNTYDIEE